MGYALRHVTGLVIVSLAGKIAAIFVVWTEPAAALALWFGPDLLLAYHMFSPRAQVWCACTGGSRHRGGRCG